MRRRYDASGIRRMKMFAAIQSCALLGIDGYLVSVEVNISMGMPAFEIVGLPDAAVRESRERVRAALKNSGFGFPDDRVIVNLAPADQKKEGPIFDLPIAVGVLASQGKLAKARFSDVAMIGELSLDGAVRAVRGALPMAISLRNLGVRQLILPKDNSPEVMCVEGIELIPVNTLGEVCAHVVGKKPVAPIVPVSYDALISQREIMSDFKNVKGQAGAKRALEIAASGGHNVLMIGSPGSGKTLLAKSMPGIMPDMTFDEALEVTRIHSCAGDKNIKGLLVERPFRAPHHTSSSVALAGGGSNAMPGEISKAHHGVLFLDELPEYKRNVLEVLRQPMEDGVIAVVRVGAQANYPAQFTLICAMNPCPCGNYGSRTRECRCTPIQISRYLGRVSGPLLDRIDMQIQVESIDVDRFADEREEEPSSEIKKRVQKARNIQRDRYSGLNISCNARLDARTLNRFCKATDEAREMLKAAVNRLNLSNRAYTRILKVARTIADLAGDEVIQVGHIAEAVQYRSLDTTYWS
ncbi:MAG: YifB family Mg chelatase-like AAA ATPase [Clostridia bacterium]|nr:YifB family Mg chelatase-like AAA ATPase [Clostridia bacterium]